MLLQTILNIIGATFGLAASLWFAWSLLTASPESISEKLNEPWKPQEAQYEKEAAPLAQCLAGAPLLLASFVLQIAAALTPSTIQLGRSLTLGAAVGSSLALVALSGALALAVSYPIYKFQAKRLLAAQRPVQA